MPRYLDTRGKSTLAIGICARCKLKFALADLRPDPNFPALYVCDDDRDQLDPYRLPAREAERIDVDHPRPDTVLSPISPYPLAVPLQLDGVTQIVQPIPWSPVTVYLVSQQVTPLPAVGFVPAGTEIYVYVCIAPGVSGATPPLFPIAQGVAVRDGTVTWLNAGLYLP